MKPVSLKKVFFTLLVVIVFVSNIHCKESSNLVTPRSTVLLSSSLLVGMSAYTLYLQYQLRQVKAELAQGIRSIGQLKDLTARHRILQRRYARALFATGLAGAGVVGSLTWSWLQHDE